MVPHDAYWVYAVMILVPEIAYNIKNIGNTILERLKKGKPYSIVANTSGRPSPTTADHVWQDLNGKIEMIIDGVICFLFPSH